MKKLIKILAGLLIILLLMAAVVWLAIRDSQLKVYFFDVGQGDAVLIRTPSRQNVIIDGGPDNVLAAKLGQALPFYDRTVDLEQAGEEEILGLSGVSLNSQVIKIGHHGSETSSGEEFLRAVSPDYAVISVGRDNKFGHPSRRIIKRLQRLGTEILRTDELGDVVFVTGGTDLDYINK